MLVTTQQAKYFQVIEYIFFFGLCGLSVYFMYGVLDKFFSGKTGVSLFEEHIKELPTIMLCFEKPSSRTAEYEYESDFKIDYSISDWSWNVNNYAKFLLKEGENVVLFDEIVFLEKMITSSKEYCYKLRSVLTNKFMIKKETQIALYFNVSEEELPKYLNVYVTSERNSYGVIIPHWKNRMRDGNVLKIQAN